MAHNKLYRNFIILQEDDRGYSSANEKALSGYAKVEAKGDKCKVSFYAQNLKKESKYSMILICSKKDCKQLIDLGPLEVNEVGKGDTSKEYYVNNIAGLGISYEKISGAAICMVSGNEMSFIMHGFMNGEESSENWRKFKVIKDSENLSKSTKKMDLDTIRKESSGPVINTSPKKPIIEAKITETKVVEPKIISHENENMSLESQKNIVTEEVNTNVESTKLSDIRESDSDDERCKKCEDKEKEKDKDKDKDKCKDKEKDKEKKDKKYCVGDEIKKIYDKLEDCMLDIKIHIPDMKEDMVICGFIKKKSEDNCNWRRFKAENRCKRDEESIISSLENSRRIEENTRLDRIDFEEYEKSIENVGKDSNFKLRGEEGKYFEGIVKGFEQYSSNIQDIDYCKWYKVKVNSMDDLCNKSDYDKYTLAYYPMLNYYPYISKENYFLLGYKCNSFGELQYIVYGIPGSKDVSEQPYGGKTGFVTWANDGTRNNGYWLMFYDYKKCSIVVPTE
ncbi:DUF7922 domain-containing protein [Clostridium butyricum]